MRSLFSTAVLASSAMAADDKCRALVLSGGGNNGAWEVGVFYGLVNFGNPADFAYDVVTGVSAGSINTLGFAGYAKGDEVALATYISDLWKNLHTSDVWVDWPLGKVSGITIMGGAVDNSPLLHFLQALAATFSEIKRRFVISSVNVETGEYVQWTKDDLILEEMPDAAVASASIPFVFPPHNWKSKGVFMDGGTVYNINMEGAISQCKDAGFEEKDIIMDVLLCGPSDGVEAHTDTGKTYENFMRKRSIHSFYGNTDSLATSLKAHSEVDLRYVIYQNGTYFSGLSELNFEGDFTWPIQEGGRTDA